MSISDSSLSAHWQFYSELALNSEHGRVSDFGYGQEELLWETLAAIESGLPFSQDCRQRLERIPWNRAKKYRRLRLFLRTRRSRDHSQKESALDVGDSVDQVRAMLSPGEWEIERRLAAGQTYAEVAVAQGLSPDTLRVRAGRWRARIRRKLSVC